MKYWRWRAYDVDGTIHEGVDRAQRFELVVMRLMQRQLYPSLIESVDYQSYHNLYNTNNSLNRLYQIRNRLSPAATIQPSTTTKQPQLSYTSLALIIMIPLLVAAAAMYYYY